MRDARDNCDIQQPDKQPPNLGRAMADGSLCAAQARSGSQSVEAAATDDFTKTRLSRLDRTVFDAISGNGYALEELRILWPVIQLELPLIAVSHAREEYLTAAVDIWNRYRSGENPNALLAASALDVMCILFDE